MKKIYKSFSTVFVFSIILFSFSKVTMKIISIPEVILLVIFSLFIIRALHSNAEIKGSAYFWMGTLMLIVMLAGVVKAFSRGYYNIESFKYLARLIEYLIIFLLTTSLVTNFQRVKETMNSFLFLAFPLAANALFQRLIGPQRTYGLQPWGPDWTLEYSISKFRVYSFLDNSIYLGIFAVFLCAVAGIYFFYGNYTGLKRIYYFLIFFLSLVIMILSGSRTALVGFIFAILALLVWRLSVKKVVFTAFLIVAIILTISSFLPQLQSVFIHHQSNISNRFLAYKSAIEMIRDNYFLGIGVGNYRQFYKEDYRYNEASSDPTTFTAENNLLEITVQTGIFGLLIFLCFFYLFFRNLYFVYHRAQAEDMRCLSIAMGIAMSGFLLSSMFATVNTPPLNMIIWLFFGLAEALKNITEALGTESNSFSLE